MTDWKEESVLLQKEQLLKFPSRGQQDGSVDKGVYHRIQGLEFDFWNPHNRRMDPASTNGLPHLPWHANAPPFPPKYTNKM